MMRPIGLFCCLYLVVAAPLDAAEPLQLSEQERETYAKSMNGVFDFSKNPRPYIGVLILDQAGNRIPSFWCGKNLSGTATITAVYDVLDDAITMDMSGALTVQITNTAHKTGMEAVLPGGAWVDRLPERKLTITITGIEDMQITAVREGNLFVDHEIAAAAGEDAKLITVSGNFSGTMAIDGKEAPIGGPIALTFLDTVTMFGVRSTFAVPGRRLGLQGSAAEGITATFYTASTPMVSKPDVGESLRDMVPLDLD